MSAVSPEMIGFPAKEPPRMFTTRPEIIGTFGAVASTHWIASQVGMAVLERGGNAFDATAAAGFTLLHREHVRIDVVNSRLPKKVQVWIDIAGFALFLTPLCLVVLWLTLIDALFLAARRSSDPVTLRDAVRLVPDVVRLTRRLGADRTLPRGVRVRL